MGTGESRDFQNNYTSAIMGSCMQPCYQQEEKKKVLSKLYISFDKPREKDKNHHYYKATSDLYGFALPKIIKYAFFKWRSESFPRHS